MQDLHDISHAELLAALEELGQPKFRAKQVEEWLWEKGATSFDEMSNLPKTLRAALAERFTLGGMEQLAKQISEDGSRKYLLRLADGASVECVGMPTGQRLAVCASTQAGCAMGCAFCATGAAGLTRSLTASEIYGQVMHVRDDFGTRVTSVVLMGQGEPFANYDATVAALRHRRAPPYGLYLRRHSADPALCPRARAVHARRLAALCRPAHAQPAHAGRQAVVAAQPVRGHGHLR